MNQPTSEKTKSKQLNTIKIIKKHNETFYLLTALGILPNYLHGFLTVAVTIGFRPQNYTVNEEDYSVTFIILLISGTMERDVTVPFFTSSGTATEEGDNNNDNLL